MFVFVVLAAVIGFAVGWLVRGGALPGLDHSREAARPDVSTLEAERDRLKAELDAAHRRQAELQAARDDANARLQGAGPAHPKEADRPALEGEKERLAELGDEIEAARHSERETRAELSELQGPDLAPAPSEGDRAGEPPRRLDAPEDGPDDLKRINGIGPAIEKTLHELGIFHLRQIAELTPDNVAWLDRHLAFPGRIEREDWIGQAKTLIEQDKAD